jgi:hypothetical protein
MAVAEHSMLKATAVTLLRDAGQLPLMLAFKNHSATLVSLETSTKQRSPMILSLLRLSQFPSLRELIALLLRSAATSMNASRKSGCTRSPRRLDMQLVAALIIRCGIAQIESHAGSARYFGPRLRAEKCIGRLDIEAGPVEAQCGETVGGVASGWREPGKGHIPMVVALFPAEARPVGAIGKRIDRIHPVELAIEPKRPDERNRSGIRVGANRYGRSEAKCAAKNLDIGWLRYSSRN